MSDEQIPRNIIAKLAEMSPEEFSQFVRWHFEQICKRPLAPESISDETDLPDEKSIG